MIQVGIHEAKTRLSELLKKAVLGEKVIIAKSGVPIAELTPLKNPQKQRVPGQDIGKIWMSTDFDSSSEIEDLFYGD